MALIGKIRKNSWLLVVVIGLALAAFVIMDMTGQSGPMGGSGLPTLVEVNGEEVDWLEFQNAERILYTGSSADVFSRRNNLYNYFVDRAIITEEAEANGLQVPVDELMDLQFGNNLSQLIQTRFGNPQTGQVDRTQLNSIRQQIDQGQMTPQLRELWSYQEKEVINERLTNKLTNMVSKGFYTPTWMVENTNTDQTTRTDFTYVRVGYENVPDSEITVTDGDLQDYLKQHQGEYSNDDETRTSKYIAFKVDPTAKDSAELYTNMESLIEEFKVTQNDTLFIETNYGTVDFAYIKRPVVSPLIADSVFSLPVGSVVGPYQEANAYKAVKVLGRRVVADSVHARHILRSAQTLEQYQAAQKTADSLRTLLESGEANFDSLAAQFSQGPTATSGGDLGNIGLGGFVKPFNDLVFFEAELNKPYTVITEFGVHVVEVLDRTYDTREEGVQLAYLNSPIIPSEETQDSIYDNVLEFVGTNRTIDAMESAAAGDPNVAVQVTTPVLKNDYTLNTLGSGQTSRDIIRWMYEPSSETGDVSPEVYIYQDQNLYFNSQYVVAGLSNIIPEGDADLESVRPTIEGLVKNQKKAAILLNELQDKADLDQVATNYDTKVDTAKGVNFLTDFIANLGEEPAVAAAATSAPLNEVSAPIEGVRGIYLIQPFNRTEPTPANIASQRQSYTNQIASQAKAGMMNSLRDKANIKDLRYTFY